VAQIRRKERRRRAQGAGTGDWSGDVGDTGGGGVGRPGAVVLGTQETDGGGAGRNGWGLRAAARVS
jgi:hypothetical protein